MDKNSKIKEYLSYSEEDGYTVLKSGWYFIKMSTTVESSSPADIYMSVIINANQMNYLRGWTNNGWGNYDGDSFSIYLNKDDKIYFSSRGNKEASSRTATGTIYPMF